MQCKLWTDWRGGVVIITLTVIAVNVTAIGLLLPLPSETRQAALSCVRCGNVRTITVRIEWWRVVDVTIEDIVEHEIPEKHAHRWWQFDGQNTSMAGARGWSRSRWEDGDGDRHGQERHQLVEPGGRLTEQWIKGGDKSN